MTNTSLNRPDEQLEYMIKDCSEAIQANPLGVKTEQYLKLARDCQAELNRRYSVRKERSDSRLSDNVLDYRARCYPLGKVSFANTRKAIPNKYLIQRSREGALAIGLRKLHLTTKAP